MGQYAKAIVLYEEHKKIAEEVGDQAEVVIACHNLRRCYESMEQYGKAIALLEEHKKIMEEVGKASSNAYLCAWTRALIPDADCSKPLCKIITHNLLR